MSPSFAPLQPQTIATTAAATIVMRADIYSSLIACRSRRAQL